MKRFALIILVCLLAFPDANAQSEWAPHRLPDEINVSYGLVSIPSFAMVLGGALGTVFTFGLAKMDEFGTTGAISVGYYKYLTDHFAVGGDLCYERLLLGFAGYTGDSTYENKLTPNHSTFYSVMPGIKLSWFNREHFGMYSKLNAGAFLQTSSQGESDSTNFSFGFQVDPIAMEFGGMSFRGFVEAGIGMEGLVKAGVRYAL